MAFYHVEFKKKDIFTYPNNKNLPVVKLAQHPVKNSESYLNITHEWVSKLSARVLSQPTFISKTKNCPLTGWPYSFAKRITSVYLKIVEKSWWVSAKANTHPTKNVLQLRFWLSPLWMPNDFLNYDLLISWKLWFKLLNYDLLITWNLRLG